jgi:hypothetical protein
MVTTNRTRFCSLVCKVLCFSLLMPTWTYVRVCVCFVRNLNKYYHLRLKLVNVSNMKDDLQPVHYLCPKCQTENIGGCIYMDKRREYNCNLIRNSQNILYIRSVKRSKNVGLNQGHTVARLANAISMVRTNSTRFCSLVCKIRLFPLLLPTWISLSLCVCVCVLREI